MILQQAALRLPQSPRCSSALRPVDNQCELTVLRILEQFPGTLPEVASAKDFERVHDLTKKKLVHTKRSTIPLALDGISPVRRGTGNTILRQRYRSINALFRNSIGYPEVSKLSSTCTLTNPAKIGPLV